MGACRYAVGVKCGLGGRGCPGAGPAGGMRSGVRVWPLENDQAATPGVEIGAVGYFRRTAPEALLRQESISITPSSKTPTGLADGFGRGSGPTACAHPTVRAGKAAPIHPGVRRRARPEHGSGLRRESGSPAPRKGGLGVPLPRSRGVMGPGGMRYSRARRSGADVVNEGADTLTDRRGAPSAPCTLPRAHDRAGPAGPQRDRCGTRGRRGTTRGSRRRVRHVDRAAVTRQLECAVWGKVPGRHPVTGALGGRLGEAKLDQRSIR